MPQVPILMPQLGESIAEATIVHLFVQPGETVEADQDLIEVETNKAVMTVTSPCGGTVRELAAAAGESHAVGARLGWIDASAEEAARLGLDNPVTPEDTEPGAAEASAGVKSIGTGGGARGMFAEPLAGGGGAEEGLTVRTPGQPTVEPTVRGLPVPVHAAGAGYLSPRLKARMQELNLRAADIAGVPGSGAGGRVTIEDFEKFIGSLSGRRLSPASPMRVAVADAMRRSWTRPIANVGMPLAVDAMLRHRKSVAGAKPGVTLYLIRALGLALAENNASAGRLIGDHIVHPDRVDIGFAVEVDDGVLVPVLRNVHERTLAELTAPYAELVAQGRSRRLPPGTMGDATATITNFGAFGLTWATPIPLPEQSLLLGLGAAAKVPFWDDAAGAFKPRTEAAITLSFDHRVVDGGGAGRLLARVSALLQEPEKL